MSLHHHHEDLEATAITSEFTDMHDGDRSKHTVCSWKVKNPIYADEACYELTIRPANSGFMSLLTLCVQGRRHRVVIENAPREVEFAKIVNRHVTPIPVKDTAGTDVVVPACEVPEIPHGNRYPVNPDSIWFIRCVSGQECTLSIRSEQVIHRSLPGAPAGEDNKLTGHHNLPPPPTGGGNSGSN